MPQKENTKASGSSNRHILDASLEHIEFTLKGVMLRDIMAGDVKEIVHAVLLIEQLRQDLPTLVE